MNKKGHYNVLAVYDLQYKAGRDHFTGILDEMADKNWHLYTISPDRFSADELTTASGEPYDGFILSMAGTDEAMERIAESNTPTVLVNITDRRLSAHRGNFAAVWEDNTDIGRRAAWHLLDRGEYKSVGYVHGPMRRFYSDERMMAFQSAMKKAGHTTSVFASDDGRGISYAIRLRQWLKQLPKPAAVMAVSDMRASDVINACRAERISVPYQVAVIGADYDVSQHEKCGMTISSIVGDYHLMGRQAVRELDFLFRHPKWEGRPHEILIPSKDVFAGESTSHSVSAARLVKMAQGYIRKNRERNLSPTEVAVHLGCSRSLAELRFSQIKGITLRKAIENARLEEVERRLRIGESTKSIVKAMHFTSDNQFYRIYKRHFGHTLRQTDI